MIGGYLSYMFLLPLYIGIMPLFSFINLHDVSWGNRPDAQEQIVNNKKADIEFKD